MASFNPAPGCGNKLTKINFHTCGTDITNSNIFDGICSFGTIQICDCYCYLDEPVNAFDVVAMCDKCKYKLNPITNSEIIGFNSEHMLNGGQYKKPQFLKNEFSSYINLDSPKGFVYFITDGHKIKIGSTTNPNNRKQNIQTGNGTKLFYICVIPCIDYQKAEELEHILHRIYGEYRLSGEWFNIKTYINIQEFNSEYPPNKYCEVEPITVYDYCNLLS